MWSGLCWHRTPLRRLTFLLWWSHKCLLIYVRQYNWLGLGFGWRLLLRGLLQLQTQTQWVPSRQQLQMLKYTRHTTNKYISNTLLKSLLNWIYSSWHTILTQNPFLLSYSYMQSKSSYKLGYTLHHSPPLFPVCLHYSSHLFSLMMGCSENHPAGPLAWTHYFSLQ